MSAAEEGSPEGSSSRRSRAEFLAGIVAGSVTAFFMSPLDVARVRLQVQAKVLPVHLRAENAFHALRLIAREGVRGYFRGYSVACLAVPLFWSTYFPLYQGGKDSLKRRFEADKPPQNRALTGTEVFISQAVAAIGAAMVCDVLTNPFWLVRTRLQTQHLHALVGGDTGLVKYSNWVDAMRKIIKYEGFTSLYKGLFASWIGAAHVAIQMPLYEFLKARLVVQPQQHHHHNHGSSSAGSGGGSNSVSRSASGGTSDDEDFDLLAVPPMPSIGAEVLDLAELVELPHEGGGAAAFMQPADAAAAAGKAAAASHGLSHGRGHGGGLALPDEYANVPSLLLASTLSKLCASAVTYSHEVVRARLQDQREFEGASRYKGVFDCFRRIAKEEGLAGLYSGFSINLLRALPATALMFVCYEGAVDSIERHLR